MITLLAYFAVGAILVLTAARLFLSVVQQLSLRLRISPLIVGTVLMAFGATLPELSLTLSSLSHSDAGLAIGTTIGSVIVNLGLLFGLAVIIGNIRIGTHKTQAEGGLLLVATTTLVIAVFMITDQISQARTMGIAWASILGLLLFLSWNGRTHEDVSVVNKLSRQIHKAMAWRGPKLTTMIALSIAGLGGGSLLVVTAVEGMSQSLGVSTTTLGFTLTAFTTSLPELAVMILSNRKHEDKTLVGALVGSSVINLTLFPSLIAWKSGVLQLSLLTVGWLMAVVLLFALTIFAHKGKVVSKAFGLLLVMAWVGFVYVLSIGRW